MPPTFYFAIGARPRRRDLEVALAVGQRHFLVPVGSTAIPWLRYRPGVRVVLDSAAWPPDNPHRPSLEAYARAILAWRQADQSWGNLDWAATYDHIGSPVATQRDHARLLALLHANGAADAPVVASLQYPESANIARLRQEAPTSLFLPQTRPCYGLGGLVPQLSPTQPRTVFQEANEWFDELLSTCREAISAGADPQHLELHLFGIGRPGFVLRSPLIVSFDSSGPAQMAIYGWQKIAPRYTPAYGLTREKLQVSREARLAYGLIAYAAQAGIAWQPTDEDQFQNDCAPSPWLQLSLEGLFAA